MGLTLENYRAMSLRQLLAANEQWIRDRESIMRDAWERARWAAFISIMPYSSQPFDTTLPWEQPKRPIVTKEQQKRLFDLLDEVSSGKKQVQWKKVGYKELVAASKST